MNDEPKFLRIRNWEVHQEYKDGRPMRFFRVYTSVLDDPSFGKLASEAPVYEMMALAARTGNKIPADPSYLQRSIGPRPVNIKRMLEAGFLEPIVDDSSIPIVIVEDASTQISTPLSTVPIEGANGLVEPSVEIRRDRYGNPLEEKRIEEKRRNKESSVRTIYDHWREVRGKTDPRYQRISDNRHKKIVARLREFSADELIRAIDAVALDPWEARPRHDDIVIIFRNEEQVQKFLALAEDDSVLDPSERQRRHLERLRSEGKLT